MCSASSFQGSPLVGLHILLVEDDADVREATQAILEDAGARVTAIPSAAQAFMEIMSPSAEYAVMLTDVVLGEKLSGFDLAAAALARRPPLPVLLVTGYAGPAGAVPVSLVATAPLLLKPFRRVDLLRSLAAARSAVHGLQRVAA